MKGKQGHRVRRRSAVELLEAQLKSGKKPEKVDGKTTTNMIPLTDGDKKRIERELEVVNKRLSKSAAV